MVSRLFLSLSVSSFAFRIFLSVPAQGVELYSTDPYSAVPVLPTTDIGTLSSSSSVIMAAARGEFESASIVIRNESADALSLLPAVAGLPDVDLKYVAVWWQANGAPDSHRRLPRGAFGSVLVPELLVNDPTLVTYDANEDTFLRVGGRYVKISEKALAKETTFPKIEDWDVRDAPTLQPVTIPPGQLRQVWLTVKVPADAPRLYAGTFSVGGASIPIELTVHPFSLPPPELTMSVYYMGVATHLPTNSYKWKSPTQIRADYQMMADHGITNPMVYQKHQYDGPFTWGEGHTPPLDRLREIFTLRAEYGLSDKPLLYVGITLTGGDEAVIAAKMKMVDDVAAVAAEFGIDDLVFYGADEGAGADLPAQFAMREALHAKGHRLFVAGYGDHLEFASCTTDILLYAQSSMRGTLKENAARQHACPGNEL